MVGICTTTTDRESLTVYLVDDSPIVRTRMMTMLGDLERVSIVGHAVTSQEAMAAIRTLRPDIVILDARPGGKDATELLRFLHRLIPSPIGIVFSHCSSPQLRQLCSDAGADYIFDKSRDIQRIIELLVRLTDRAALN
jgi:DNA-binding NarL/FixJ family response regulator